MTSSIIVVGGEHRARAREAWGQSCRALGRCGRRFKLAEFCQHRGAPLADLRRDHRVVIRGPQRTDSPRGGLRPKPRTRRNYQVGSILRCQSQHFLLWAVKVLQVRKLPRRDPGLARLCNLSSKCTYYPTLKYLILSCQCDLNCPGHCTGLGLSFLFRS